MGFVEGEIDERSCGDEQATSSDCRTTDGNQIDGTANFIAFDETSSDADSTDEDFSDCLVTGRI